MTFFLAVNVADIDVATGNAPDADLSLRTDPITLTRLLRTATAPEDALADGMLQLEGRRGALDDFLAAFALRSRA